MTVYQGFICVPKDPLHSGLVPCSLAMGLSSLQEELFKLWPIFEWGLQSLSFKSASYILNLISYGCRKQTKYRKKMALRRFKRQFITSVGFTGISPKESALPRMGEVSFSAFLRKAQGGRGRFSAFKIGRLGDIMGC